MDEPVAGADEGDLAQRGMVEIVPDPHEGAVRLVRRLAEHVEQGSALLDELEQVAIGLELLRAHVAEQVGGTADIQPLLGRDELREGRAQRAQEVALARRETGVVEAAAQEDGSE